MKQPAWKISYLFLKRFQASFEISKQTSLENIGKLARKIIANYINLNRVQKEGRMDVKEN